MNDICHLYEPLPTFLHAPHHVLPELALNLALELSCLLSPFREFGPLLLSHPVEPYLKHESFCLLRGVHFNPEHKTALSLSGKLNYIQTFAVKLICRKNIRDLALYNRMRPGYNSLTPPCPFSIAIYHTSTPVL